MQSHSVIRTSLLRTFDVISYPLKGYIFIHQNVIFHQSVPLTLTCDGQACSVVSYGHILWTFPLPLHTIHHCYQMTCAMSVIPEFKYIFLLPRRCRSTAVKYLWDGQLFFLMNLSNKNNYKKDKGPSQSLDRENRKNREV